MIVFQVVVKEWAEHVCKEFKGSDLWSEGTLASFIIKADPEAGVFPLKVR